MKAYVDNLGDIHGESRRVNISHCRTPFELVIITYESGSYNASFYEDCLILRSWGAGEECVRYDEGKG